MRDAVGAPGVPGACWRALQLHGAVLVEHGGRAAWSVLALRGDEALDALFDADRASMMTEIAVRAPQPGKEGTHITGTASSTIYHTGGSEGVL